MLLSQWTFCTTWKTGNAVTLSDTVPTAHSFVAITKGNYDEAVAQQIGEEATMKLVYDLEGSVNILSCDGCWPQNIKVLK